jgi:hypothetical protein
VLVPEVELVRIEREGEFRIYVENTFHTILRDVRLRIRSPAFHIEVEPSSLRRLVPGERTFFVVRLTLKEGFEPGDYPLRIDVEARSAELRPTTERMEVIVERDDLLLPKEEVAPPLERPEPEEIPPIEEEEPLLEEPVEEKKRPEAKDELSFQREELLQPIRRPLGEEAPSLEGKKPSEEEPKEVVVEVGRIPIWESPYFYGALILLLLAIIIWRKLR